ncbi:MAG: TetR/AcrR family transcriptional regulator [Actinobacteria bacterium]|nr:TetR/AcrR family transcriptional regulator [Actinomycetota bacterium]
MSIMGVAAAENSLGPLDGSLVEAAARTVERFGVAGATLERIAAEAQCSRVTLHRRGITREAILQGLARRAAAAYREALWPALVGRGTGRERLELALNGICVAAEDNLAVLAGLFPFDNPDGDDAADPSNHVEFQQPIERLLLDGIADGTLSVSDPAETASLLFNAVGWSYVHLRTAHGWEGERAARGLVQLLLDGVSG